jgi:hypothetical protein
MAMLWAKWRGCVGGVVLLFLMGCAGQQFVGFGLFQSANGGEYTVAGSAESVALTMQANLRQLGLSADVTQQGEDIRVASKTRNGDKFALVLKHVKSQNGEVPPSAEMGLTRVRFEWENGPDEQTRTHVLASLNVQSTNGATK